MQNDTQARLLFIAASTLCIAHAALTSFYAWRLHCSALILILAWFVWPVLIGKTVARKREMVFTLLVGFAALLPALWYTFIAFIFSGGM